MKSLIDVLAPAILLGIWFIVYKLSQIIDLLEQSFVLGLQ